MYTPVNPSYTIQKWDVKGYKLHGCVTMMLNLAVGDKVKQTKFMRGCFDTTYDITQTCPCIMQRFLNDVKMTNFSYNLLI